MPSGFALPAMVTSSIHHGESSALTRISTSRLPNPLGGDRLRDLVARHRLGVRRHGILEIEDEAVGGQVRAFSSARAFDPGMNSRLRRGRIMAGSLQFSDSPR